VTDAPGSLSRTPALSPWQIWLLACRPKTLPAAAAPVVVGSAVAFAAGSWRPGPALACLAGALLLQIGANLANDYADFIAGADSHDRLGPLRVTQAGLLRPHQVLAATWAVFAAATVVGAWLVALAGWPIVVVGLAAIASAWAYTAGPYPLGYHGLGEPFVFVFFGLVAVAGTGFVQIGTMTTAAVVAALPMGLLATAILVVNNLRDIEADRVAGKRTLAARFGPRFARTEYLVLVVGAFAVPPLAVAAGVGSWWLLLSWMSAPLAVTVCRVVLHEEGRPLNRALAMTGLLELTFALLYAAGLVIPRIAS